MNPRLVMVIIAILLLAVVLVYIYTRTAISVGTVDTTTFATTTEALSFSYPSTSAWEGTVSMLADGSSAQVVWWSIRSTRMYEQPPTLAWGVSEEAWTDHDTWQKNPHGIPYKEVAFDADHLRGAYVYLPVQQKMIKFMYPLDGYDDFPVEKVTRMLLESLREKAVPVQESRELFSGEHCAQQDAAYGAPVDFKACDEFTYPDFSLEYLGRTKMHDLGGEIDLSSLPAMLDFMAKAGEEEVRTFAEEDTGYNEFTVAGKTYVITISGKQVIVSPK